MYPTARNLLLAAAASLLLLLPPVYFLKAERQAAPSEPVRVLSKYLKAVYARDFRQAYRFISAPDKRLKEEKIYVRERGPFTGFALDVARRLAESIQFRALQERLDDDRARIKLALRLPDANALAPVILNWDDERLNALPSVEQKKILASLDKLKRDGGLKMIDGEEAFVLVREGKGWKVFLDWAAGVRVSFNTVVPPEGLVEAQPTIRETVARSGELFTVAYHVKNRAARDLFARIIHRVEPKELAGYLDLVDCGLLLPVRMLPGEEQSYASTYLIRGDIPEGKKELQVTYEFRVER